MVVDRNMFYSLVEDWVGAAAEVCGATLSQDITGCVEEVIPSSPRREWIH